MAKKNKRLPVRDEMCATCPFAHGSKLSFLQDDLAASAINQASRICHSTGSNNAINKRTGKKPLLCRGARDIQLKVYAAIGFIESATDAAWDKKCKEMNL